MRALREMYQGADFRIARIVQSVLLFIPFPTLFIGITMIYVIDEVSRGVLVLSFILVSFVLFLLLRKGYLRTTIITFSTVLNVMTTWICITGNGIHDIGIVVYPLTILFASIVLRKSDLWFVSILSGACISLVVLGETFGLYMANPTDAGNVADIIIVFLLLACGFVTTSSLSRQIRLGLANAKEEVEHQEKIQKAIESSLVQKGELLRQVHHRVKNHLSFINSLIDIEAMENSRMAEKKIQLQNKVIAVARVHDQLYQSDNYEVVETKLYFENVISGFITSNHLAELSIDIQVDEAILPVKKAINLGLVVNEVLSFLTQQKSAFTRIVFILTFDDEPSLSVVALKKLSASISMENKMESAINQLVGGIEGEFEYLQGSEKVIFEVLF